MTCFVFPLSSFTLLQGRLDVLTVAQREGVLFWLVSRQKCGYQGRPHKPEDTCYSFWVGASLALLGHGDIPGLEHNRLFLYSTQNSIMGGFGKWVDVNAG